MFITALRFFLGCEGWKWAKRVFFRWREARDGGTQRHDIEYKAFREYMKEPSRVSSGSTSDVDMDTEEKAAA